LAKIAHGISMVFNAILVLASAHSSTFATKILLLLEPSKLRSVHGAELTGSSLNCERT
jgi:hypothetical protein